ncbi:alpha/beta hydrolase [Pseudonocardia ailaonensis]|uniref:Alpha/beta hydrolase n=1 Tax=Pseudonocardia ailaonensis TaxID=367279 RepID=A0ABN2N3A8_9PSEU
MSPLRRSPFLLVLVLVGVLAGCTTVAGTPTAAPAPTPDALNRYYSQTLSWGPCAPFATSSDAARSFGDPRFDCAKLEVPLDYAKPDGKTAQIAVLRARSTGTPQQRIGSLLVNPGGPGAPGTEAAAGLVDKVGPGITNRFDLVGFDPRGVGASRPSLDCLTDAEQDRYRAQVFADPSPAGVAAAEAHSKQYADLCAQRVGTDVLANVGTRDVVKDMDILRQVLGDEKVTYYGYSYGTSIGSTYAEAFPSRVRAMVLDGAVDPTQDTITGTVDQSAGFQQAFDAYGAWCTTQANCPLGRDPKAATATFQKLVQPLIDRPVRTGDPTRTLGFQDAITGVSQALYLRALWPALSVGISRLAGGDGSLLLTLADLYYSRGADGKYSNMLEAFQAISCMDNTRVTAPADVAKLVDGQYAAAPFTDTGRGPVDAKDPCAYWPVPPTMAPHTPKADGIPPVVVVSVTGDPATPYQAGVDLAKDLNGRLLKVDGTQHTAGYQGTKCVDDKLTAYLTDGTLPAEGASCVLSGS